MSSQRPDNTMHINRLTLAFCGRHANFEGPFQDHLFSSYLRALRGGLTLAVILFLCFSFYDAIILPQKTDLIWTIRFAIFCPLMFLLFLFTFSKHFKRFMEPTITAMIILGGTCMVAMILIAQSANCYSYTNGLVQVLFFIHAILKLRFIWRAPATWCLIVIYLILALGTGITPKNVLIADLFNLTCINAIGMMAAYVIEYHTRRDFYLSRQLESKKQRLAVANQYLEERVAKRTADLSHTNQLLKDEIHERKAVEDSFKSIFEIAAAGMLIVNAQTRKVVKANPAAADMVGTKTNHIKGMPIDELICLPHQVKDDAIDITTSHPIECELITRKQTRIPILKTTKATAFNDQAHWIVSFVNMQKIKEAEEAKRTVEKRLNQAQHLQSIGTMAGGIAHDFNNILFGMMGFTELALDDAPEDSLQACNLKEVLQGGQRAKEMVNQILIFSRQDHSEKHLLQPIPLIKEALKLLRATIPTTIEIQTRYNDQLNWIDANPAKLHQVIMNLCTNAAHAMSEQGGCLGIELGNETFDSEKVTPHGKISKGKYVRISVSDTGTGMPPDLTNRIFEPFFTTKSQGEGTGMGLSVTLGIVQTHGGTIQVHSQPGKGSRFDILLPAISRPEKKTEELPSEIPTGHEYVLYVDDEKPLTIMMDRMLSSQGYKVTTCQQPHQALELVKNKPHRFDLVITDLTMPKMKGTRLARELLKIRNDLPIILCTGYGEQIIKEDVHALGIRDLLIKPIQKIEIATVIRRVLAAESSNGAVARIA